MFKRKFEEEAAPAPEAAPAADPKASLIEALTSMGLNAEQAEAVYAMAEDLIAAGSGEEAPAEEAVAVEASRQRDNGRTRMGKRKRGRGMSRRGRRSQYSRERRAVRGRDVRNRRSELSAERRARRQRRTEMSAEQRMIARQRKQIAMMRDQLKAQGSQPGAQKLSSNPIKGEGVAPQTLVEGQ